MGGWRRGEGERVYGKVSQMSNRAGEGGKLHPHRPTTLRTTAKPKRIAPSLRSSPTLLLTRLTPASVDKNSHNYFTPNATPSLLLLVLLLLHLKTTLLLLNVPTGLSQSWAAYPFRGLSLLGSPNSDRSDTRIVLTL